MTGTASVAFAQAAAASYAMPAAGDSTPILVIAGVAVAAVAGLIVARFKMK